MREGAQGRALVVVDLGHLVEADDLGPEPHARLHGAELDLPALRLSKSAASNRYIRALRRLKEILSSIPGLKEQL